MQEKGYFSSKGLPYLLLAPQILIIFIFFIWPAAQTLFESFIVDNTGSQPDHLIGLQNYFSLFNNPAYLVSFKMTLLFSFSVTLITLIVGFFLAQLVHRVTRGKIVYSVLFLLPFALAPAVAGMIMRSTFDLKLTHFALISLMIIIASWQQIAYTFIFYLISLHRIPSSLIDAAKLDGAHLVQRFWHILLPLLVPMTFFLFIINLMYAFFNTFGLVQVMTQTISNHSVQLLMLKVHHDGLSNLNLASAATQSVVLMIMAGILTVLLFRSLKKKKIF